MNGQVSSLDFSQICLAFPARKYVANIMFPGSDCDHSIDMETLSLA